MALHVTAAPLGDGGVAIEIANAGRLPDDGAGRPNPDGLGIGLRNVRARLDRVYRGRASITLEQDREWVRARIRLPKAAGCVGVN
jgi:LytS/YehU family sensor histidine kinase